MAKQVKRRRGTTAEHASFTGAAAELTIDTDKETAVIHDGATAGGFPLLREDMSNVDGPTGLSALGLTATASELNRLDGDLATVRSNLGLTIGTDVQEHDAQLDTLSGLSATQATALVSVSGPEFDQIANINSVTISNTQWGYLGALDQALATTDDVRFNNLELTGTINYVNETNLQVEDKTITINKGGTDGSSEGAGLIIERVSPNHSMLWNSTDGFDFSDGATFAGTILADAAGIGGSKFGSFALAVTGTAGIRSSNDAPLTIESTDAVTGIQFTDPNDTGILFYAGTPDLFYTSSSLAIGATSLSGSEKLRVVGASLLEGAVTMTTGAIGTDNFSDWFSATPAGWEVSYAGVADYRTVYTDELIAKAFTVDVAQALAGSDFLTKSVATLAENFTIPAVSSTGSIKLEDLPGLEDFRVFESGDWLRIRIVSHTTEPAVIGDVYGTISSYVDNADGTQSWTFTVDYAGASDALVGMVVHKGAVILDYGVSGDAYIERTVLDRSGTSDFSKVPYDRIVRWTNSGAGGPRPSAAGFSAEVLTQRGNLNGLVSGYDSSTFGSYMTDTVFVGDPTKAGNYFEFHDGSLATVLDELSITIDSNNSIVADASGVTLKGETFELVTPNLTIDSAAELISLPSHELDGANDTFSFSGGILSGTDTAITGAGWTWGQKGFSKSATNGAFLMYDSTLFSGSMSGNPSLLLRNNSNRMMVVAGDLFYNNSGQDEYGIAFNADYTTGDPLFQVSRNGTTGDLTARLAGSFFDSGAQWAGDPSKANATFLADWANQLIRMGDVFEADGATNAGNLSGFDFNVNSLSHIDANGTGLSINASDRPHIHMIAANGEELFVGADFDFTDQDDDNVARGDFTPVIPADWDASADTTSSPTDSDLNNQSSDYAIAGTEEGKIVRVFADYTLDINAVRSPSSDFDSTGQARCKIILRFLDSGGSEISSVATTKEKFVTNENYDESGVITCFGVIPAGCDKIELEYESFASANKTNTGNPDTPSASAEIDFGADVMKIVGSREWWGPKGFNLADEATGNRIFGRRSDGELGGNKITIEEASTGNQVYFEVDSGFVYLRDAADDSEIDSWAIT